MPAKYLKTLWRTVKNSDNHLENQANEENGRYWIAWWPAKRCPHPTAGNLWM